MNAVSDENGTEQRTSLKPVGEYPGIYQSEWSTFQYLWSGPSAVRSIVVTTEPTSKFIPRAFTLFRSPLL